jgi:hypothetical protein
MNRYTSRIFLNKSVDFAVRSSYAHVHQRRDVSGITLRQANALSKRGQPFVFTPDSPATNSDILFTDDLARLLRTSRSTIERRMRSRSLPFSELPRIDKRPRWSRRAVEAYLTATSYSVRAARRDHPTRRVR